MQIIAETKEGVLISATSNEVKEILNATTGERPSELKIGQKIPAIDYASTITKIKTLSKDSYYVNLLYEVNRFNEVVDKLKEMVNATNEIDL